MGLPPMHTNYFGCVASRFRTLAEDTTFGEAIVLEFQLNFKFSAIRNHHVVPAVMGLYVHHMRVLAPKKQIRHHGHSILPILHSFPLDSPINHTVYTLRMCI